MNPLENAIGELSLNACIRNLISRDGPASNEEKDGITISHQIISKEPLTHKEEDLIFKYHFDEGNKWAEIAKRLGKRTDNIVKNHFYATLRRYMRRINKIMKTEVFKNLIEHPSQKVTTEYIYK